MSPPGWAASKERVVVENAGETPHRGCICAGDGEGQARREERGRRQPGSGSVLLKGAQKETRVPAVADARAFSQPPQANARAPLFNRHL